MHELSVNRKQSLYKKYLTNPFLKVSETDETVKMTATPKVSQKPKVSIPVEKAKVATKAKYVWA